MVTDKTENKHVIVNEGVLSQQTAGVKVLRGILDPHSLQHLQVGTYQRDVGSLRGLQSIVDAIKKGEALPDIELGMRGDWYSKKGSTFRLEDSVFIVDGLQRVSAALRFLSMSPEQAALARIGAVVRINATEAWEIDRFHTLNTQRNKVSPNIILRNMQDKSPAIRLLIKLTTQDPAFPLHERVAWRQNMAKKELITALDFMRVIGRLHSHLVPGTESALEPAVRAIDQVLVVLGEELFVKNIRSFIGLLHACWGFEKVHYRKGVAYVQGSFLRTLAKIFSEHSDFWASETNDRVFSVDAKLQARVGKIAVSDPSMVQLAGAGGQASQILRQMIIEQLQSGRGVKPLTLRLRKGGVA